MYSSKGASNTEAPAGIYSDTEVLPFCEEDLVDLVTVQSEASFNNRESLLLGNSDRIVVSRANMGNIAKYSNEQRSNYDGSPPESLVSHKGCSETTVAATSVEGLRQGGLVRISRSNHEPPDVIQQICLDFQIPPQIESDEIPPQLNAVVGFEAEDHSAPVSAYSAASCNLDSTNGLEMVLPSKPEQQQSNRQKLKCQSLNGKNIIVDLFLSHGFALQANPALSYSTAIYLAETESSHSLVQT